MDFRRDFHRELSTGNLHMESNAQTHYAPPIAAYAMNRRHVLDAIMVLRFTMVSAINPPKGTLSVVHAHPNSDTLLQSEAASTVVAGSCNCSLSLNLITLMY